MPRPLCDCHGRCSDREVCRKVGFSRGHPLERAVGLSTVFTQTDAKFMALKQCGMSPGVPPTSCRAFTPPLPTRHAPGSYRHVAAFVSSCSLPLLGAATHARPGLSGLFWFILVSDGCSDASVCDGPLAPPLSPHWEYSCHSGCVSGLRQGPCIVIRRKKCAIRDF